MKKFLFFLTGFFLWLGPSYGQNKEDKQLQKKLDEILMARFKDTEPGCAVLIAKKGTILYNKAFGSADIELNVDMKSDMIFKLGSITKQFTAVAILQLMEQGKLSLQDSIQQYIKDFPSKGYTITIEHLLTHTSGIKDYLQIDYADPYAERKDYSPSQVVEIFKTLPLEFEPGTKYSYSNSGYFLLGCIIENLSGKKYQDYIKTNLLEPLSLDHTYFGSYNAIVPGRVKGYRKENGIYRNADYWSMSIAYSAGEMMANTEDLFKWHMGLRTYTILKEETLEKAFTPFQLKNGKAIEYGYGWMLSVISGSRSIAHGGTITGFLTNEMYYPSEDIFIAVLFNSQSAPRDELSMEISAYALNKILQPDIKVSDQILAGYTGTYSLSTDPKRTITIAKQGNGLIAEISGQSALPLVFQTTSKFQFKNLVGAEAEFIQENGKTISIHVMQNGLYVWKKIE